MKKFWVLASLIILSGCTESSWNSLEDYLLDNNYDQEQKISSNNIYDLGSYDSYPEKCIWSELERVVDGDTIIVELESERVRVRMIGIDTPESKKEGTAIEPFSLEAGDHLKDLLSDEQRVCLVEDELGDKYDVYGRKLAYVFSDSGADLNALMLESGMARAYTRFNFDRKNEFITLEQRAKERSLGIWQ